MLDGTVVTGAFFEKLANAPLLERIDVKRTDLSDDTIVGLEKMPALKELDMESTAVGDKTAAAAAQIKSLERIDMAASNLTDVGVRDLLTLPRLSQLGISQMDITDAAFSGTTSETLSALNAVNTKLTDKTAMEVASKYPSMSYFNSSKSQITKEGAKSALDARSKEFKKMRFSD